MLFKITAYVRTPPNRQVDRLGDPPYHPLEYPSEDNRLDKHVEWLHQLGYDVLSVTSKPAVPDIDEGNDGNQPTILEP